MPPNRHILVQEPPQLNVHNAGMPQRTQLQPRNMESTTLRRSKRQAEQGVTNSSSKTGTASAGAGWGPQQAQVTGGVCVVVATLHCVKLPDEELLKQLCILLAARLSQDEQLEVGSSKGW